MCDLHLSYQFEIKTGADETKQKSRDEAKQLQIIPCPFPAAVHTPSSSHNFSSRSWRMGEHCTLNMWMVNFTLQWINTVDQLICKAVLNPLNNLRVLKSETNFSNVFNSFLYETSFSSKLS